MQQVIVDFGQVEIFGEAKIDGGSINAALDRVFMMAAQGEPMLGTLVDRLLRDRIAVGELVEDARPHMEDMRLWPSSGPDSARGDR